MLLGDLTEMELICSRRLNRSITFPPVGALIAQGDLFMLDFVWLFRAATKSLLFCLDVIQLINIDGLSCGVSTSHL